MNIEPLRYISEPESVTDAITSKLNHVIEVLNAHLETCELHPSSIPICQKCGVGHPCELHPREKEEPRSEPDYSPRCSDQYCTYNKNPKTNQH